MSLIKQSAPLLSMEAYEEVDRPLAGAIESAARDETCVWHRVSSVASSFDIPVTLILDLAAYACLPVLLAVSDCQEATRKPAPVANHVAKQRVVEDGLQRHL